MMALLEALNAFRNSPFGSALAGPIAAILVDLLDGKIDDEKAVFQLVDVVLGSGLAPALLKDDLTADGVRRAEAIAAIAKEARLRIEAMKRQP